MKNFFKTNFALIKHHNFNVTELENMLPWERETYVLLVIQYLKQEQERQQLEQLAKKKSR
ncbi:MAG: hypothetical protein EBR39_06815 [Betaproteobacteria bacterium]|nr:hypothetical protein [Betaproteobacteria bacterium]